MRRRKRYLVATAICAISAWAGCALVLDLGDEAQLRPSVPEAAAPIESGPPVDAGGGDVVVEASAPELCGLPPSPKAECATCIQQRCCDISKACAGDPECVQGLECVKDCMAQIGCIFTCAPGNPRLDALKQCSSFDCTVCSPGPECANLGACARQFNDAGEEGLLRAVARGVVLEANEATCRSQRQNLGAIKDAEACVRQ